MIYNKDFIWLHFPKCAGTKIEGLFSQYFSATEDLFQDPVSVHEDPSIAWHDSILDRMSRDPEFIPGERMVIISFRRLPSWLISRYNFEVQRSPNLNHRPELLLEGKFIEENGKENHADNYAKKYLPDKILKSYNVRFLRVEYFESDFKSLFGKYIDISIIPNKEYLNKINTSSNYVPLEIINLLHDSKNKIYNKCPYWRLIEEMAYGKIGN